MMQTRTGEKTSKFLRIGYPLSESVAPPGTAWGTEGLRGNEANENKVMVLASERGRKGQSGGGFAQEDMAFGLRLRASAFGFGFGFGSEDCATWEKALRWCGAPSALKLLTALPLHSA